MPLLSLSQEPHLVASTYISLVRIMPYGIPMGKGSWEMQLLKVGLLGISGCLTNQFKTYWLKMKQSFSQKYAIWAKLTRTGPSLLHLASHSSSGSWMGAKKAQTWNVVRTPTQDLFMWLLGSPRYGGWVPRERVPGETQGNHIGFYDQGLQFTQCYLCWTPFTVTALPRLKGRENRFYLLVADSRRTCGIKILVWPLKEI